MAGQAETLHQQLTDPNCFPKIEKRAATFIKLGKIIEEAFYRIDGGEKYPLGKKGWCDNAKIAPSSVIYWRYHFSQNPWNLFVWVWVILLVSLSSCYDRLFR